MNQKTIRTPLVGALLVLSALCLAVFTIPSTQAYAAGNTNIQTLSGTERVEHTASVEGNSYSENYYFNTGIRLYGAVNNGVSSTGNEIKVDSTAVCLDFSGANTLYKPKTDTGLLLGNIETGYNFQILQGGTVKWQAKFTGSTYTKDVVENGETVTKTYMRKTINVNGKTTVTTSESASYTAFKVSDLGTNVVNLNDGRYTVKITRTYTWTHWKAIFSIIPYQSASTFTGTLVIDTAAPALTAKGTASGRIMANGAMTNELVTVTVSDANHARLYYKTPSSGGYMSTTAKSYTSGSTNGRYYVYAVDSLGHRSADYSFYYDSVSPTGTLYGGTSAQASGAYAGAEYVKYIASDNGSGIANCYVKMPCSSYYTNYIAGTQLANEGTYSFYATDKAGNSSATAIITLDRNIPTGTLYAGESVVANGGATNADYIQFVPFDSIGIAQSFVKKPGAAAYEPYTPGSRLTEEGEYRFYATDLSGRTSGIFTITLSREIPKAQLYADDTPIGGNSYTNGGHIRFACEETCYVKLPGSEEFVPYLSGAEYYKPGKYVFYGISEAGNSTGEYSVVVDRTKKSADVRNVAGGMTDGNVVLDWTDGDSERYAPVTSVTINGKPYTKGQTVYTIDTGSYMVRITDAAGNIWETEFRSRKPNVLTKTLQKEYYEIHDADGKTFSFASYEKALAFAEERENGYVCTGEWKSELWDAGVPMDGKDSVNAANGTYFIYKKSGCPEEQAAYFTRERLDEVIAEFAEIGIKRYYYWEKEPAPAADGVNLYGYSDGRSILASSVELGENIVCLIGGEQFIGSVYETEGKTVLTVCDEWGNTCEYSLTVVRRAPELFYAVGDGPANVVSFDRTYYFKDPVTVSISDAYDEMAMFNVYDCSGGLLGSFSLSDAFEIASSGRYTVRAVNHFGVSEPFTLVISRSAPETAMTENAERKKLEITVTESEDDESHIQTLEIYRSLDGGETWTRIEEDDYGTVVSPQTLAYAFRTSGLYRIVVTDEFRTGIDAVTAQLDYSQAAPEGILTGVEDGGFTNTAVRFEWTDEAKVTLEKDGGRIAYASGDSLTEDGRYTLTFENFDGYTKIYTFTIDAVAPEITLEGVENGGAVSGDVRVSFAEEGAAAELFKDGKSLGAYLSGDTISKDGRYKLVVTDRARNFTEVTFTIDKTVDYAVNVCDKGLSNSVIATANESITANMTRNEETVEYKLGEAITEPGEYLLTLTDTLGNQAEIAFEIVKPLVKEFVRNFDGIERLEGILINGGEARLNYGTLELREDGVYEVGVIAGGRTYPFTVTVDGTAPSLILTGVENGGTTKEVVRLAELSEPAEVKVILNGEEIAYSLGEPLTKVGQYRVTLTDLCGNSTEYSFEIRKGINGGIIAAIVIGGILVVGGVAVFLLKRKNVI